MTFCIHHQLGMLDTNKLKEVDEILGPRNWMLARRVSNRIASRPLDLQSASSCRCSKPVFLLIVFNYSLFVVWFQLHPTKEKPEKKI